MFIYFHPVVAKNYPCSTGFGGFLNHQLYITVPFWDIYLQIFRNRRWTRKPFKSFFFQGSNRTLPLKKNRKKMIHFDLTISSNKKTSVGDIHHDITWYSHKYGIMWSLPVGKNITLFFCAKKKPNVFFSNILENSRLRASTTWRSAPLSRPKRRSSAEAGETSNILPSRKLTART